MMCLNVILRILVRYPVVGCWAATPSWRFGGYS